MGCFAVVFERNNNNKKPAFSSQLPSPPQRTRTCVLISCARGWKHTMHATPHTREVHASEQRAAKRGEGTRRVVKFWLMHIIVPVVVHSITVWCGWAGRDLVSRASSSNFNSSKQKLKIKTGKVCCIKKRFCKVLLRVHEKRQQKNGFICISRWYLAVK